MILDQNEGIRDDGITSLIMALRTWNIGSANEEPVCLAVIHLSVTCEHIFRRMIVRSLGILDEALQKGGGCEEKDSALKQAITAKTFPHGG